MRTENQIPLLAGSCAGIAHGVLLGPHTRKSMAENRYLEESGYARDGNCPDVKTPANNRKVRK